MEQGKVRISSLSNPERFLLGSSILELEANPAWQVFRQTEGKGACCSEAKLVGQGQGSSARKGWPADLHCEPLWSLLPGRQIPNLLRTLDFEYPSAVVLWSKSHFGVSRCSSSFSHSPGFSREFCIIESPLHLSSHSASAVKSVTIGLHLQQWVRFPSASNTLTLRRHHAPLLPPPPPGPFSPLTLSS